MSLLSKVNDDAERSRLPLTEKLQRSAPVSCAESEALLMLQGNPQWVRRNTEIVTKGERSEFFFVVLEGTLVRYRVLRDGRRQIIDFSATW